MEGIGRPPDIEYPWIAFCPIMFNHVFRKSWKEAVQWHGLDCYKDLQEHWFFRWNRICKKVSSRSNNYTSTEPYTDIIKNFFLTWRMLQVYKGLLEFLHTASSKSKTYSMKYEWKLLYIKIHVNFQEIFSKA